MSTAVINVKVDHQVKTKAKRAAARLGLSLSGAVNAYLRSLIKTETICFSTGKTLIPNPYLIKAVRVAEKKRRRKNHSQLYGQ